MRFFITVAAFVLFSFISKGSSLDCYTCNSAVQPDCKGNAPDKYVNPCALGEKYCITTDTFGVITRFCSLLKLDDKKVNFACETDRCNGGVPVPGGNNSSNRVGCNYMMSIIGITMAVLIKQWFA